MCVCVSADIVSLEEVILILLLDSAYLLRNFDRGHGSVHNLLIRVGLLN